MAVKQYDFKLDRYDLQILYLALLSHHREMILDDVDNNSSVYVGNEEWRRKLKEFFDLEDINF